MSGLNLRSKEKRNYIRMNIDTEVICKIRGTNEEFKGLSKNLSYTGLQFATSKHLKEEAELDVILKIPGGIPQPPLKAIFAIKRINKQAGDQFIVSGRLRDVK